MQNLTSGYFLFFNPKYLIKNCATIAASTILAINSNILSVTNLMIDLNNIDDVAKTITGDNDIKCIEEKVPLYECDCSKERIEKAIIALGKKEALSSAENNNGVLEIKCNFCNKAYTFNKEQICSLFKK